MTRSRVMMLAPFGMRPKGTTVARVVPLARRLAQRGWDVKVLAPPFDCPEDGGRVEIFDGAEVRHLPWGRFNVLRWTAEMISETSRFRPAVVHLFKPKGCGGLALPFLRALGKQAVVVDMDDREGKGGWNDILPYPWYAKSLFQYQEASLPLAAAVVTVASRALETLAWGQGVPKDKVFYLPNAIDRLSTQLDAPVDFQSPCRFLVYSRFHEFDLFRLLGALAPVFEAQQVRLELAGQLSSEALQMLEPYRASGAVTVHGWVERSRLEAIAAHCQAAIVPCDDSLINRCRCSAKLFELIGLGLPIVAHNVGEAGSLIFHGYDGLLAPPGDYEALSRMVSMLAGDPASLVKMAKNQRSTARRHLWDSRVDVCEKAYHEACSSQ